ncbi:MAG: DUF5694 domain-containing protein [Gammaproteobacteria bacterium]|nr:DUF5694 domain-containing protein [Gammaproteobacteria bacterium]
MTHRDGKSKKVAAPTWFFKPTLFRHKFPAKSVHDIASPIRLVRRLVLVLAFLLLPSATIALEPTVVSIESKASQRFPDDRNSSVMVLGTFHFFTLAQHEIHVEPDDMTSPNRQQEIRALVEALKAYAPTMIALEAPSEFDENFNAFYTRYLDGSWDSSQSPGLQRLERTELYQIGFRLAKALSHDRVYAIDEMTNKPLERMEDFAKSNGYDEFLAYRHRMFRDIEIEEAENFRTKTVGRLILEMSSQEHAAETNSRYVEDVRFGNRTEQPGVDVLIEWIRRDVLIFQNLYNITKDSVGERILVIFGADHVYRLRELVESSPDFHLVEPSDFLLSFGD